MSNYPSELDDDTSIFRVDQDLNEVGADVLNQQRDAIFQIEKTLGVNPQGSVGTVAARLNNSLNADGSIKASALNDAGLVSLPIDNEQIGAAAGIKESKLDLDYSTIDLYTMSSATFVQLGSLTTAFNELNTDFNFHLDGNTVLSDGSSSARHVLSHIDINAIPFDSRDTGYVWTGLIDKNGDLRSATQAAEALLQINDDLINHENSISDGHVATTISVDTDNFIEIPNTANNVQDVLEYLDNAEVAKTGEHRATQHANGIPRIARLQSTILPDGYSENIVPVTPVTAFLIHPPSSTNVDDISVGDDLIKFNPDNSGFIFDSKFSLVRSGDIVRIDYNNGLSTSFIIDSVRYIPNSEYIIRVNGINLCEADGYARIDRPLFSENTYGILATASANANPIASFNNILSSVIVGNPRAASVLGLGFDAGQLNSDHYKLYLELYPSGNPDEKVISLPAIDVTGNGGITPGKYNLESIVLSTNNSLRSIGYNYRFIAFEHNGEFGIMLADAINNASFAIIKGINNSGGIATGIYTQNVIGGNEVDSFDAFGLGVAGSDVASPAYQSTWVDEASAQIPTYIIRPFKQRNYVVNGKKRDSFAPMYLANEDGYWDGYISARNQIGAFTVETTYTVELDLSPSGLKPGKTIVIQPTLGFTEAGYSDVDYGRFIIKNVNYIRACGENAPDLTQITVINSIHGTGTGFGFSSLPVLPVKIYFSYDSVSFNNENIIDFAPTAIDFHRLHEIYIDENGKTFSHERARLPIQTESGDLLATSRFHIKSVSPKLRGYRGSNALIYNKYIRFYVLSYNSDSGEFDGYLGKPVEGTDSIVSVGPRTTARKNTITRFYDETYLDYIEFIYNETSTSPGSAILSDQEPRYVDIELFSSLENDPENFLLATCEVNWDAISGQEIVQRITDRREFGSINELNFTNSAMEFINAGTGYLHENGVISGLGLDFISTVIDSGEIYFKGGRAKVNNTICTVNNYSVTIPQIYPNGSSLPQTLDWAICVNEKSNLECVLLTTDKDQFFATIGASNYYTQSVTFQELVDKRKDLTPIAIANVTIASLTVNEVRDVRRFISSQHAGLLVLAEDGKHGSFSTLESAANWVSSYGLPSPIIEVRGRIESFETFDLSSFSNGARFIGSGGTFYFIGQRGFLLSDNITFENVNFEYFPSRVVYIDDDIINSDNGLFYSNVTSTLKNINFKNCNFKNLYEGLNQRPPFISVQLAKNAIVDNFNIINNTFEEINEITGEQALIAFYNLNNGGSTNPSAVINLTIHGNSCDYQQGIYITTIKGDSGPEAPGINSFNSVISNNSCGTIGYLISSIENTNSYITQRARAIGLTISNNNCSKIGSYYNIGEILSVNDLGTEYSTGNVSILENYCAVILSQYQFLTNENSSLIISNNTLRCSELVPAGSGAINVGGNDIIFEASPVIISNNNINYGYYNSTQYTYTYGILSSAPANINSNIVSGFSGFGIFVGNDGYSYSITDNQIIRGSASISSYIVLSARTIGGIKTGGIVTDNYFDSTTVNGSSSTNQIVKLFNSSCWYIARNKNHLINQSVSPGAGQFYISNFIPGTATASSAAGVYLQQGTTNKEIRIQYDDSASSSALRQIEWDINLNEILPNSVYVKNVNVTSRGVFGTNTITVGSLFGEIVNDDTSKSFTRSFLNADYPVSGTLVEDSLSFDETTASELFWVNSSDNQLLRFSISINGNANDFEIDLTEIIIEYHY